MPNQKKSITNSGNNSPATPPPVTSEDTSNAKGSANGKRTREGVPIAKKGNSATTASASKATAKPGTMGPPQTPVRPAIEKRQSAASTPKTSRPEPPAELADEPEPVEQGQADEEEIVLDDTTIKSQMETSNVRPAESTSSRFQDIPQPNPEVPIEDFDWQSLEQRHYERMQEFEAKEQAVYEDLHRLNMMFQTWAGASQTKESERASKRLKTRIAYVQQGESELSEKRQHYLHVVNAFQSALNLLERT